MAYCKYCWHFDRCNAIGKTVDFPVDDGVCLEFDACKPMTNGDNIRSMPDEELAEQLILYHDAWDDYETHVGCFQKWEDALKAEVEWLKQPAED